MTTLENLPIDTGIFNAERNYEDKGNTLFLGEDFGLLDSVNRVHPELFNFMKLQKSMDWDEHEFALESCRPEFSTRPKGMVKRLEETVGWQWIGDSVATHSVAPVIHPFLSCDDAWLGYLEINKNEGLHALSYSEIVKYAFPGDAGFRLREVSRHYASLRRMQHVGHALKYVKTVGAKITLGLVHKDSDEAIDAAMLFVCTMLGLERLEFVPSFAVTFAIGEESAFLPVVLTVQKISQDEWNVHIPFSRYVLLNERRVERSAKSLERIRPTVEKLWADIAAGEFAWNATQHELQYDVRGLSERRLDDVVYHGLHDLYVTAGWANPHREVKSSPLPFMDKWLSLNGNQGSPQETRLGGYFLGGFYDGVPGRTFDTLGI